MSRALSKKGFPLQIPKPRAKDPLVELQKRIRRVEEQEKLSERLKGTETTGVDIH